METILVLALALLPLCYGAAFDPNKVNAHFGEGGFGSGGFGGNSGSTQKPFDANSINGGFGGSGFGGSGFGGNFAYTTKSQQGGGGNFDPNKFSTPSFDPNKQMNFGSGTGGGFDPNSFGKK